MTNRTALKRALDVEGGPESPTLVGAIPTALQTVIAVVREFVANSSLTEVDRARFEHALHHASEQMNSPEHEPIWRTLGGSEEIIPTAEDVARMARFLTWPGTTEAFVAHEWERTRDRQDLDGL